jgi:hypothetical protein
VSALTIGLDVLSRIPVGAADFNGAPFDPSGSLMSTMREHAKGSLVSMVDRRRFRALGE